MKQLQTLLIIITAALFFTACQKEETTEVFDTISGILSAGENVSVEDLNGLQIYLGQFHDTIDFSNITFETAIDSVGVTTLNADGSFSFSGLAPGNYGLAIKNEFIFSNDTALIINFNGNNEYFIQKEIERLSEDNAFIVLPPAGMSSSADTTYYTVMMINLKKVDLHPTYRVKNIHCYFDSELHPEPYAVKDTENEVYIQQIYVWSFGNGDGTYTSYHYPSSAKVEIEFEIWTYDKAGNVTEKSNSTRIPFYSFQNSKTPSNSWAGNPFDIKWVANTQTLSVWSTDKPNAHYEISVHK